MSLCLVRAPGCIATWQMASHGDNVYVRVAGSSMLQSWETGEHGKPDPLFYKQPILVGTNPLLWDEHESLHEGRHDPVTSYYTPPLQLPLPAFFPFNGNKPKALWLVLLPPLVVFALGTKLLALEPLWGTNHIQTINCRLRLFMIFIPSIPLVL